MTTTPVFSSANTRYFNALVQDLTAFSTGNISLTASQIVAPVLTGRPPVEGRNLYLPIAGSDVEGMVLIIRNRSTEHAFNVWGGITKVSTLAPGDAVQIACDGYNWFVV